MQNKRFDEIDFARAFGIIGVIIIHIFTYNLSNPFNKFIWNYAQFVVVAFVFCSGFVLSAIYQNRFTSILQTISWYKKRLIRLLIPFYVYLIAHYAFWILFPNYFSGLGLSKSFDYFIKSALFIGGTNFNWLPLLFLILTFLFPIFTYLFKKKKLIFVYSLFALAVTLFFTFFKFPYSYYRFVMWIPWSLVLIFAMYFYKKEIGDKNIFQTYKRYLTFGTFLFLGFLVLYFWERSIGNSLTFYDHKYPPDYFYLLFGVSMTSFLLILGKLKIWQQKYIKNIYFFISKNSYSIFFIHYITLDSILTLSKKYSFLQNPLTEFSIIIFVSLLIVVLKDIISERVSVAK